MSKILHPGIIYFLLYVLSIVLLPIADLLLTLWDALHGKEEIPISLPQEEGQYGLENGKTA